MPTYTILGSTGNVGGSILEVLLNSDSSPTIHAYCRSKQKLLQQDPNIENNHNVKIFEGPLTNTSLLSTCFANSNAIFIAIAVSNNQPNLTIAQDTAHQVLSALSKLREEQEKTHPQHPQNKNKNLPKLIILSSASTDHRLMSSLPHFLLNTLYRAFSFIYDDLKAAEKIYRAEEEWLEMVFIKPGALTKDVQRGYAISLDEARSPVSFLDLAAGMVEIAGEENEDGRWVGRGVTVNATSSDVAFPWDAPGLMVRGLIVHFAPWLWRFIG